jgi:hypothetical protein
VTTWFAKQPGSDETLLALYDAVGAAEELDLAEEAREEAFWADVRVLRDWPSDEADAPAGPFADENVDEIERIPMSQAVGLVEHLLGGQPVRGGERPAH